MNKNHNAPQQQMRITEITLFLRNWRINEGYTQTDFANIAGVHFNSIYNLEQGKFVNVKTLFKCIDATGLSLSEFFEGMN